MHPSPSGFDKLAQPYRWMEYLSFGPMLMQTRLAFLPKMLLAKRALVLGDGDGRFCAALLRASPYVRVHAVDSSATMLRSLERRAGCAKSEGRLVTHAQDVRETLPDGPFDLICTHFLLDCLEQDEVQQLATKVRTRMDSGLWVISEFAVPGGCAKWLALPLIGALYRAFGLLTGLQTRQLPQHQIALGAAGFRCIAARERLFGILRSELWALTELQGRPSKLEVR